jgi:hypothetical protein
MGLKKKKVVRVAEDLPRRSRLDRKAKIMSERAFIEIPTTMAMGMKTMRRMVILHGAVKIAKKAAKSAANLVFAVIG